MSEMNQNENWLYWQKEKEKKVEFVTVCRVIVWRPAFYISLRSSGQKLIKLST